MYRLLLVIMLSAILMVWDHRKQHLEGFRAGLLAMLTPLDHLVSLPANVLSSLSLRLSSRAFLLEENQELRDELILRRAQIQRLVALEIENSRLRKLLGSVEKKQARRLVAEILTVDSNPYRHLITINKGTLHDVYLGQAVLDAYGVMGQVVAVGPLTSQILLITDTSHGIPVKVARSGVRSVAVGTGNGQRLSLQHVPATFDIKEGDLLVTSGLGQVFPEGFPVAEVIAVASDPGKPFVNIDVVPKAQLSRSGQVVLVWNRENQLATAALEARKQSDSVQLTGKQ